MATKINSASNVQKMSLPHTCHKCKKSTEAGLSVMCSGCKKYYDFDCMGISEKLFRLKDAESKKKIKCKICIQKTKKGQTTSSSGINYVTTRKKYSSPKLSSTPNLLQDTTKAAEDVFSTPPTTMSTLNTSQSTPASVTDCDMTQESVDSSTPTNNTFNMLSEDEEHDYQLLNTNLTLRRSCPDLNGSTLDNTEDLKHTISKLQRDLASAHNEVETLLTERSKLQKQITAYQKKVKQLTLLCKKSKSSPIAKTRAYNNTEESPNTLPENRMNKSSFHHLHQNQNLLTQNFQQDQSNPETKTEKRYTKSKRNLKQKYFLEKSATEVSTGEEKIEDSKTQSKHRVIILADQQGRHVQQTLQELLGTKYDVFCFWKPGASLSDILLTCKSELNSLCLDDYVVLIGFRNDTNIFSIRYTLASWIARVQNTNIIVCESSYNRHLNEKKLNNEIKYICKQFNNTVFLDMNFFSLDTCKKMLY